MNNTTGVKDYLGIRKGLDGHSLGELEAQILDIVWELNPPITAAQVFRIMYPKRELSYSTVMLTMSKLARKGFLTQQKSGDKKTAAFIYAPMVSRVDMARRLMEEIARRVFRKPLVDVLKDTARQN